MEGQSAPQELPHRMDDRQVASSANPIFFILHKWIIQLKGKGEGEGGEEGEVRKMLEC